MLEDMGVISCVEGLAPSSERQLSYTWEELLGLFWQLGKFTRLDVAFDDFTGGMTVDKVKQAIDEGRYTTKFRKCRYGADKHLGTGEAEGEIISFGLRASPVYVRCYDKAMREREQGRECLKTWNRMELETKDERAQVLAIELCNRGIRSAVQVLANYIDFREVEGRGEKNKRRRPRLEWWADFLQQCDELLRIATAPAQKTLEDTKRWIWRGVSRSLAMVAEEEGWLTSVDGAAKMLALLANGKALWQPRHIDKLSRGIRRKELLAQVKRDTHPLLGGQLQLMLPELKEVPQKEKDPYGNNRRNRNRNRTGLLPEPGGQGNKRSKHLYYHRT